MKKTYWWRVSVLLLSLLFIVYGYISIYSEKLGLCHTDCIIEYNAYIDPSMFTGLFLSIISLLLFFISDNAFKKWLKFTIGWFLLDIIFIVMAPEYSHSLIGGPTKELVSVWMGSLFVIISIIMFVVLTIKEKKNIKL